MNQLRRSVNAEQACSLRPSVMYVIKHRMALDFGQLHQAFSFHASCHKSGSYVKIRGWKASIKPEGRNRQRSWIRKIALDISVFSLF